MVVTRLREQGFGASISAARFGGTGCGEWHLCATASVGGSFHDELKSIRSLYQKALSLWGIDPSSALFFRFFVSDVACAAEVRRRFFADARYEPAALSIVEQQPQRGHVALWAYHVEGGSKQAVPYGVALERGPLVHHLACGLSGIGADAKLQTEEVFDTYIGALEARGGALKDHVVRTWLFCSDIDRDYGALVEARRHLFGRQGLSAQTHLIASTGIQGRAAPAPSLVAMDGYAVLGLCPDQLQFLEARERLGPAHAYGSSFERGVRISYGDRAHLLISGTASIDPAGNVVHVGDPEKQTVRLLGNIEALLQNGGASFDDVISLVAYVRHLEDAKKVEPAIDHAFGKTPRVIVEGPVCRPQWLVEVECWAAVEGLDPRWPCF